MHISETIQLCQVSFSSQQHTLQTDLRNTSMFVFWQYEPKKNIQVFIERWCSKKKRLIPKLAKVSAYDHLTQIICNHFISAHFLKFSVGEFRSFFPHLRKIYIYDEPIEFSRLFNTAKALSFFCSWKCVRPSTDYMTMASFCIRISPEMITIYFFKC